MNSDLKQRLVAGLPPRLQHFWTRVESSPVGYRLARGFGWSVSGAVLSRLFTLVSTVLVARLLGKTGVGEVAIVQSTVGMFSAFAGLGMGLTATKFVAEYRHSDPGRAASILRFSTLTCWYAGALASIVVACLAPVLARSTLGNPALATEIQLGSALLMLGAVNGGQTGALAGLEAFKSIAKVSVWSGILSVPVTVGAVYWWDVRGGVCALVMNQAITCLLNHEVLRQEKHKAGLHRDAELLWTDLKLLWNFSLPGMLCTLLLAASSWACNAILVRQPGGYGELGILNAATGWLNAVTFIPSLLAQVVLPVLAQSSGEQNTILSRKVLLFSTKLNAALVFPLVILGCCASPFLMRLYGPQFHQGWPALVLVLITAAVTCTQYPSGQFLVASGRMWLTSAVYAVWGVASIGLTWQWADEGAFGAAGARLAAQVLYAFGLVSFAFWVLRRTGEGAAAQQSRT